jgi:hypothetical protein
MKTIPAFALAILALLGTASLGTLDIDDKASAPKLPPSSMTDATYAAAVISLLKCVDRDAISASTRPDSGLLVYAATPSGQGADCGITSCDILLSIDGNALAAPELLNFAHASAEWKLIVWSKRAGQRSLTIERRDLGFRY